MAVRSICIHQPVECFLSFFIVKKQTTLRSKRNKEKYQRVVVVFSLCFLFWVKELVVCFLSFEYFLSVYVRPGSE